MQYGGRHDWNSHESSSVNTFDLSVAALLVAMNVVQRFAGALRFPLGQQGTSTWYKYHGKVDAENQE